MYDDVNVCMCIRLGIFRQQKRLLAFRVESDLEVFFS